jgi:hypothetical protein
MATPMKKKAYFASEPLDGWPTIVELEPYFLSPPGKRWFFETGNDSASFKVFGAEGTEHTRLDEDRIDISLSMWGNDEHGVLLIYSRKGGRYAETFCSKGDLGRIRDYVYSTHDTLLPIGLFIPFADAWQAVKEFIEADAALPKCISWIADRDLPPDAFPDPVRGAGYV